MQFTVNVQELLEGLNTVTRALAARPPKQILEGVLMLAPLAVSLIYRESFIHILAFLIPIVAVTTIGFLLQLPKPRRNDLYQKEGFALTAMVWLVMTLFGALPFVISGDIPNYINAFFEICM